MINVKDVNLLTKSVNIPILNNKNQVEKLYFDLVDKMHFLDWDIDIWDFEYMDYFTAGIYDKSYAKIVNENLENKFKEDIVNCINNILNK
ncbi:hypothetical protein DAC20_27 [Bacteroides phage DAC20]|nr:hypothetical protein DAC19_27 [Bacteroides phage DAC19]QIG63780.1 hypothetical protein DAC20_27 [Bacteroides phage DAC20]